MGIADWWNCNSLRRIVTLWEKSIGGGKQGEGNPRLYTELPNKLKKKKKDMGRVCRFSWLYHTIVSRSTPQACEGVYSRSSPPPSQHTHLFTVTELTHLCATEMLGPHFQPRRSKHHFNHMQQKVGPKCSRHQSALDACIPYPNAWAQLPALFPTPGSC